MTEIQFEENRNKRANARDYLANFVNNISISDINSIKAQSSMLKELTIQSDEVSRNLAVIKNLSFYKKKLFLIIKMIL